MVKDSNKSQKLTLKSDKFKQKERRYSHSAGKWEQKHRTSMAAHKDVQGEYASATNISVMHVRAREPSV